MSIYSAKFKHRFEGETNHTMIIGNITNRLYALIRPFTIPDIVEQHRSQLVENKLRLLALVVTNPDTGIRVQAVVDVVHEMMEP